MTDPYATGTQIYVQASTCHSWHNLATDRRLPLLPEPSHRADSVHTDPATGMTTLVLVLLDGGNTSGWLTPNPDQCPLCHGDGVITCREGSLPRTDKGEIDIPWEILLDCLHGRQPAPVHDDVIDVQKPCPLCRSIDYALTIDDEIGWV